MLYTTVLWRDQIRLVDLFPGQWTDDISCELFDVPWAGHLRQMIKYKALSYAWGLSSRHPPRILVNDCQVEVTVNLECALRHLRRPHEHVILWVDALCINQSNTKERNSQVAQMRDIYSTATEVIVFLGNGVGHRIGEFSKDKDPGASILFKNDSTDDSLISQFLSAWRMPFQRRLVAALDVFCLLSILARPPNPSNTFELLEGIPSAHLTALFEALRRMLSVRWWDRIWVVQEAVVARTVTVRYGNISAPWAMLADVAMHSRQESSKYANPISTNDTKVLSLFSQVVAIERLRHTKEGDQKPSLLSLLRDFSNRKASDERDKIYALLGLCQRGGTTVRPNYSADVRSAYKEVAVDIIRTTKSLSVLTGDLGRKNRQDLPSWVPDWSGTFNEHDRGRANLFDKYNACRGVPSIINGHSILHNIEQMELLVKSLKSADRPADFLPPCISVALERYKTEVARCSDVCDKLMSFCRRTGRRDINRFTDFSAVRADRRTDSLRVRGKCIGKVAKVLRPLYSTTDMNVISETIAAWSQVDPRLEGMERDNSISYPGKVAFIATVMSDLKKTANGLERLKDGDDRVLMSWYQQRILKTQPLLVKCEFGPPTAEVLDSLTEAMLISATNRVFFITRDGRMGLGPASMTEHDNIYVLPGGRVPFVLRHASPADDVENEHDQDKTFHIVGDCFLHGAMDGQLSGPEFRSPDEGSLPDDVFDVAILSLKSEWESKAKEVTVLSGASDDREATTLTQHSLSRWARYEEAVRESWRNIEQGAKLERLFDEMRKLGDDWTELETMLNNYRINLI